MFKLALAQMLVTGGTRVANLDRAVSRVESAAAAGAQVVLLPEALDLGWTHPSAGQFAESIPEGHSFARLREAAVRHHVYLCAGLVERSGSQIFNAAILVAPDGELLLHHRKLNELEIAHEHYAQGGRLAVARTPLATFGLMICADAFAPRQIVSRTLGLMGADVILSPCAWAVPADHNQSVEPYGQLWLDNYQPVAREFRLWIAGASNVGPLTAGPWTGRNCIGCSLVVGPNGDIAATGSYGPEADELIHVEVSPVPRPARGNGWGSYLSRQAAWSAD